MRQNGTQPISKETLLTMQIRKFSELTLTHASATIKAEAKQTYIGYIWLLLDPLMFIAVYYVVFGLILGNKAPDFIVFLLIGILSFQWFQSSISQGAASIFNAGGLIKQIKLNKLIFPASKIIHNFWQFSFVFLVYCVLIYSLSDIKMTIHLISVPFIIFTQLAIITGITTILAAYYPFFPDIKHVIQPILRAVLFISGVFFPVDKVPEDLKFYFFLNPMANLIEAYRNAMLSNQWPDFIGLSKLLFIAILLILVGQYLIKRNDSIFAKVIP